MGPGVKACKTAKPGAYLRGQRERARDGKKQQTVVNNLQVKLGEVGNNSLQSDGQRDVRFCILTRGREELHG